MAYKFTQDHDKQTCLRFILLFERVLVCARMTDRGRSFTGEQDKR